MLKELCTNEENRPQLFSYEQTELKPGHVRVKSQFGAPKHGTEMTGAINRAFGDDYFDEKTQIFQTRTAAPAKRRTGLGNMWVGEITALGEGVSGFALGQRVAGYGHLASTHDVAAARVLTMPDRMTWQEAMCFDPMQFALSGLRDANMRIRDAVLVSGLGAIGLMAAQAAKLAGASFVAVSDPIEKRRKVALENGADCAFDPTKEDIGLLLQKYVGSTGMDVVIETSANYIAVEHCLRALGYRGSMAFVGRFKECHVSFNLGREGHYKQQNIFFSRACSEPNRDYPRWDFDRICRECWALLASGQVRCDNIIDPVVDFADSAEGYTRYILENPGESVKMGVRF